VRPDLVIDASEGVQLGLQFGDSDDCWLSSEPAFQGLVEAFDLALGLGMAVLLGDAEAGQWVFEAVAAAGEAGGVDRPVVGQGGLWQAVGLGGGQEGGDHDLAADTAVGAAGEQVAGVVIKPVDDLHAGTVGELPVGEVRLPALVGLVGLESPIGAFGPLLGFRRDQPGGDENTADGGERWWSESLHP
jgi:hypothetical protein